MQFFPVSMTQGTSASTSSSRKASEGIGGFDALVERLSNAANAPDSKDKNTTASSDASQSNMLHRSPGHNETATGTSRKKGDSDDFEDTPVTTEDFAALKESLSSLGFSDARIEELEDRVKAGGLKWGSFLDILSAQAGPQAALALRPGLSPDMRAQVGSFLDKVGVLPGQIPALIDDLENGNVSSVWQAVSTSLGNLSKAGAQQITPDELKAISTALGLSPKAQEKLTDIINGKRNGNMSKSQLEAALAAIGEDTAEMQSLLDDDATSDLRNRLMQVLNGDSERTETMQHAGKRDGKDVEQMRERIARSVKDNTDGMNQNDGTDDDPASMAEKAARSTAESFNGEDRTYMDKQRERMNANQPGGSASNAAAGSGAEKVADADSGEETDAKGKDADDKAWYRMFNRVAEDGDTAHHARHADTLRHDAEQAELAAVQSMETAKTSAAKAAAILKQANVSPQQVLDQVQNGLLKGLENGGKELTLRLDPPELGQLTLILQVNNKEVSATIRTENHEMSKVVADQMHHLKHTLEQQGLKVDKLEVQTELPRDTTRDAWQGESQHNMAREQENRQRIRNRMRLLRSEGQDISPAMQPMTSPTALLSHEGVDIFA